MCISYSPVVLLLSILLLTLLYILEANKCITMHSCYFSTIIKQLHFFGWKLNFDNNSKGSWQKNALIYVF